MSEFRNPSNFTNGHTVDREGRLVHCEHGGRCVSRTEHDGSRSVLASHWNGKRLNSPNDVVVKSDGSIWFTDPTYGIDSEYEGHAAPSEIGASNVYRIDPDGSIHVVAMISSSRMASPSRRTKRNSISSIRAAPTGRMGRATCRVFDVVGGKTLKGGADYRGRAFRPL